MSVTLATDIEFEQVEGTTTRRWKLTVPNGSTHWTAECLSDPSGQYSVGETEHFSNKALKTGISSKGFTVNEVTKMPSGVTMKVAKATRIDELYEVDPNTSTRTARWRIVKVIKIDSITGAPLQWEAVCEKTNSTLNWHVGGTKIFDEDELKKLEIKATGVKLIKISGGAVHMINFNDVMKTPKIEAVCTCLDPENHMHNERGCFMGMCGCKYKSNDKYKRGKK